MTLAIKRVYEAAADSDGTRVLVDRLWPRGLSRQKARVDLWLKDIAPSDALRRWFGHDPGKWPRFQRRYRDELAGNPALAELRRLLSETPVLTLVYAALDPARNNAVVLAAVLAEEPPD